MSNPKYGYRFICDGEIILPKKQHEADSKIFQASKLKKNKKNRRR